MTHFRHPGTKLSAIVILVAALAWFTEKAQAAEATPEGRFGAALDANRVSASTEKPNPAYNGIPLTVELWARLEAKQDYNILVANELKASPTHWEVYTERGPGTYSAYLPGCSPSIIKSPTVVTDGKWHYLAMTFDGNSVRLSVDANQVAHVKVVRAANLQSVTGSMAFGALVSGGLGCKGLIDEVRISNCIRPIAKMPTEPFSPDEHTVGLWHFDSDQKKAFVDHSSIANAAKVNPPGPWRKSTAPAHSGPSLAVMPPAPDLAESRRSLRLALDRLKAASLAQAGQTRDALLADWEEQFFHLGNRIAGREKLPAGAAEQAFDRQALVYPSDRDPLGVVLRRTQALLQHLQSQHPENDLTQLAEDFKALRTVAASVEPNQSIPRKGLYLAACALRRKIAFSNPLVDFDRILFVARGNYQGSRKTGPRVTGDQFGQHFATQYFAFNSIPGGGLFAVCDFKSQPQVVNLLENSVVASGRLEGRKLEHGAFLSPDLSYDANQILFAWTENREHKWTWSKETTWNIFRVDSDGSNLVQLTDGPWNDFDPCWLPNGRVAFISERRGGYIRCFGPGIDVPNYVLHGMKADGTDVYPLSYYETSEWHPSVNNDGMLVYTRWDYTDRENCLGSNFWICHADGRDPRGPHGNYPYPWHTFADNTLDDSRIGRPYVELNIRAIPNSHLYILTAGPHHGEAFGSLVMLDLRQADDGFMSQLKRITPYPAFPESEMPARSQYPFGTPWPLSEDFYLCNWWENLYLLDRFGNRELLCENSLVFGETNYEMRLIDPIPLRPRRRPPELPVLTNQGQDAGTNLRPATVSIVNVYESDIPFPPTTKIRWLRVTQNILKSNPPMGVPMIGYQAESTPRIPLGIVPVEPDGSVYLEAPVEKELIFQVLDENFMAVQSMRSVAYVHRGEHLTCIGCHEDKRQAHASMNATPMAMRRPPSKLQPEVGSIEPITYYRLVQPVFERSCIPCHRKEGKGPVDMAFEKLEPLVFYFAGGMRGSTVKPIHGGSRTIPGRFGARDSIMGRALLDENHRGKISPDDYRRVVLWLDSNSLRLGAFHDEDKQVRGEVVWPLLDVDLKDPLGVEKLGTEPRPGISQTETQRSRTGNRP